MGSGDRSSIIDGEQSTLHIENLASFNNYSEEAFTVQNLEKVVASYHTLRRCDFIELLNRTSRKCQAALFSF